MAHKKTETADAAPTKMEPQAHVSWPNEGIRLSGDYGSLGLGKKAKVILEGAVRGFSMQEYGCSIDLKVKTVRVEDVSDGGDDDESMPMTEVVRMMGKKGKSAK